MADKYLDESGLSYFWTKLKAYFQEKLISGTNIKTINSQSLLGSGDIQVAPLDMFYPVGSYYETSDASFDPNASWGGTWELETEGQVHIGAGATYTIDGALTNATDGGAKTSSVSFAASNIQSAVAASSALSHHRISTLGTSGNYYIPALDKKFTRASSSTGRSVSHMQPYIIVNRWHRTA